METREQREYRLIFDLLWFDDEYWQYVAKRPDLVAKRHRMSRFYEITTVRPSNPEDELYMYEDEPDLSIFGYGGAIYDASDAADAYYECGFMKSTYYYLVRKGSAA